MMITAKEIVRSDERVKAMAADHAKKIAKGYYTIEEATEDLIKVAEEVLIRKLNGRPAISNSSYGRVESNKDFAREVYEILDGTVKVGMACTELLYSDCYACEVIEVVSPKMIKVREKDYEQKNIYDGECKVLDKWFRENIEEDNVLVFTLRRGGYWIEQGQPRKYGSVSLSLGYARTYRDPEF